MVDRDTDLVNMRDQARPEFLEREGMAGPGSNVSVYWAARLRELLGATVEYWEAASDRSGSPPKPWPGVRSR